jgi:putative lipase involved disintegration of autophagic bodies
MKTTQPIRTFWSGLDKRGRVVVLVIVGAVALTVLAFVVQTGRDWWKNRSVTKQIDTIQTQVNQDLQQANQHGAAADRADVRREVAIETYNAATERRVTATSNSRQAAERLRAAEATHEKNRHANPIEFDSVLSDDELCARLDKLKIPCR